MRSLGGSIWNTLVAKDEGRVDEKYVVLFFMIKGKGVLIL